MELKMYCNNLSLINKDNVQVGDVVGISYNVMTGYKKYKHSEIKATKISRITPKRTKFVSEEGKEFDRYTNFYELDEMANKETELALAAKDYNTAFYNINKWRTQHTLNEIPDKNIKKLSELMNEIVNILNGNGEDE